MIQNRVFLHINPKPITKERVQIMIKAEVVIVVICGLIILGALWTSTFWLL